MHTELTVRLMECVDEAHRVWGFEVKQIEGSCVPVWTIENMLKINTSI